jgi:hypothetical protein
MKTGNTVTLGKRKLKVGFEKYQDNDRTAMVLYTSRGEEWDVVSVNVPDYPLGEKEIVIKSYSDSALLPALEAGGIVKRTGLIIQQGFVEMDICELLIQP